MCQKRHRACMCSVLSITTTSDAPTHPPYYIAHIHRCRPHVTQQRFSRIMAPATLSAFHPSPKRKREQPPPIPLLNTALRPATTLSRSSPGPPDSPRNAVADQLGGMSLTSVGPIPMSPLTPVDDGLRKKPKLEAKRPDSGILLDSHSAKVVSETDDTDEESERETIVVGGALPDSSIAQDPPKAQQPRTTSKVVAFAQQPTALALATSSVATQVAETTSRRTKSKDRSGQPSPRNKSPSPPLSSLTWQDSEITGHLVDPTTDPDDDGTGLNGIGFRPTPAIAQLRAQRRRQQVLDWKAREAREARAKRSERRRRGVGGIPSREATVEREVTPLDLNANRRMVKFAV